VRFSSLFSRWRQTPRNDLRFIVYTRHGCHLCDDAWALLQEEQRRHGFILESVDIDALPQLVSQYGECVPVVTVNGKVRFRGCVNRVLLQRLLSASPASLPAVDEDA
jgi:glutaredoxin